MSVVIQLDLVGILTVFHFIFMELHIVGLLYCGASVNILERSILEECTNNGYSVVTKA